MPGIRDHWRGGTFDANCIDRENTDSVMANSRETVSAAYVPKGWLSSISASMPLGAPGVFSPSIFVWLGPALPTLHQRANSALNARSDAKDWLCDELLAKAISGRLKEIAATATDTRVFSALDRSSFGYLSWEPERRGECTLRRDEKFVRTSSCCRSSRSSSSFNWIRGFPSPIAGRPRIFQPSPQDNGVAYVDRVGHLGGGIGVLIIAPLIPRLGGALAMLLIVRGSSSSRPSSRNLVRRREAGCSRRVRRSGLSGVTTIA